MSDSIDYSLQDALKAQVKCNAAPAGDENAPTEFSRSIGDEDRVRSIPPWRSIPLWVSNDAAGMYFEIYRAETVVLTSVLRGGGEWFWRLCSSTGSVQALSAAYSSKRDCLDAIEFLRRGAREADLRQPRV